MFWEKNEIGQFVLKKLTGRVETWEDGLSGNRIPYRYRPRIRAQQIEKFRAMLPYSLAGNAISAFLLFCALAPTQDIQTLSFWLATLLLLSVVGMKTNKQIRPERVGHRTASKRKLRRPYIEIVMMAAAWAVAPIFFLPIIDDHQLAIIMTVGAGTMAAGAFLLSPIPRAASLFVTVFASGFFIGFINRMGGVFEWALLALLFVYGLVMVRAIYWNFGNYVEAWLHQFKSEEQTNELQQQKDMISVLLKDFEESASDVLWQIDKEGRFFEVSEELAGFFGLPVKVLEKLTIWRIFDEANLIEQSSLKALVTCLESQHAFSDRVISHRHMGRELFWNISAKPVYANGSFDGFRGVLADVTEAQNASSRISYLAHYDPLTDLPNRASFGETLERCLYAQQTEDEAFCIIALDLDFFKAVNDAHGHDIGDKLLRRAAQLMRTCLQADDFIARIGGDEFAIIQRHIKTRGQTMALCDHLVEVLGRPITIEGIDLQIGVSMGVAFCPFDTLDMGDLQKFADLALYKSKQEGRSCVRYFKQDMDDAARARRALEADLKKALNNGEFELHYQPLLDAKTSKVTAYEALLRWNHPERGLVSPDSFIQVCEQSGLILAIGDWVIRQALHEVASWASEAKIAINLSAIQVKQRGLVSTVVNAISSSGIAPSRVEFEITETVLLDDSEEALSRLRDLQALGVSIALDDFGTGYASLSYLRIFSFDKIKIDRSFVHAMAENRGCAAIVQAVTNMAKAMGVRSTAEGVETLEQLEHLRALGCDDIQGFYFSPPKCAADLIKDGYLDGIAVPEDDIKIARLSDHKRKKANRA